MALLDLAFLPSILSIRASAYSAGTPRKAKLGSKKPIYTVVIHNVAHGFHEQISQRNGIENQVFRLTVPARSVALPLYSIATPSRSFDPNWRQLDGSSYVRRANSQMFVMRQFGCYVDTARHLAHQFFNPMRHRDAEGFDRWLAQAQICEVIELRRFAAGLQADLSAVRAAFRSHWSNGQVEDQINRLKYLKRQIYGRAKHRPNAHSRPAPELTLVTRSAQVSCFNLRPATCALQRSKPRQWIAQFGKTAQSFECANSSLSACKSTLIYA